MGGGTPGPFDCYLTLRGIKTLGLRMEKHSLNARHLADWLAHHPTVEQDMPGTGPTCGTKLVAKD